MAFPPKQFLGKMGFSQVVIQRGRGGGAVSDLLIYLGGQGLRGLKIYIFIWGNLILNPNFFLENLKI